MIEDKGKRKNAAIYFGRSSSLKVIKALRIFKMIWSNVGQKSCNIVKDPHK